ncbi:MAG: hypothetical protein VX583_11375 [Bdellovibrionota bacterium]|nr:hypothetical protein [Pseudobdellovibrionaceae bacterium]
MKIISILLSSILLSQSLFATSMNLQERSFNLLEATAVSSEALNEAILKNFAGLSQQDKELLARDYFSKLSISDENIDRIIEEKIMDPVQIEQMIPQGNSYFYLPVVGLMWIVGGVVAVTAILTL